MNSEKCEYIQDVKYKLINHERLNQADIHTIIAALSESEECFQEPYYELVYHDKYDRIERRAINPVRSFTYKTDEIETKFNTDKFKDGQSIHKQLLAKMYHTNRHKYMINNLLYSVPTFYMAKDEFKLPTKEEMNAMFGVPKFEYKKIIFNGPCTIILWKDGTKTMAKTSSDEEVFDPEKGVAICFMKKMLGHTETNKILRKASEQYEEYIAENRPSSSLDEFIEYLSSLKSKTKSVDHIDQSAIEEVKKLEEAQIEEEDD